MNKPIQFPARDQFKKENQEVLTSMKNLEGQLQDFKQQFFKFKAYEQLAFFKENVEIPLSNMITEQEKIYDKMFSKK